MSATSTLTGINRTFRKKGGAAMKNARKKILQTYKDNSNSSQALRYFSKVTLHSALPVFPALLSMSCEAVGGDPEKTIPFGEAIVLISAAADIHDDVIDQSLIKGPKQTVLGKFNAGTAILAGDILLVQGLKQLTEAAESLSKAQSRDIIKSVSEAVFEICTAESLEVQLHNRFDVLPAEYLEIIRLKAVVPSLSMKIGATIGNGSDEAVRSLAEFGRIYGINSLIIEEFIDLLDTEELKNRLKNECPPLPIIYALQNPQIKTKLLPLLTSDLDDTIHKSLVDMVVNSSEMTAMQKILFSNLKNVQKPLQRSIKGNIREELENILSVPLKSIEF